MSYKWSGDLFLACIQTLEMGVWLRRGCGSEGCKMIALLTRNEGCGQGLKKGGGGGGGKVWGGAKVGEGLRWGRG